MNIRQKTNKKKQNTRQRNKHWCILTCTEHWHLSRQLGLLRFSTSQSISNSYTARYAETQRELKIKKVVTLDGCKMRKFFMNKVFWQCRGFVHIKRAHHVCNICQLIHNWLSSEFHFIYETCQWQTADRFQSCFSTVKGIPKWPVALPARKPPISYVHHSTHSMTMPGTARWMYEPQSWRHSRDQPT